MTQIARHCPDCGVDQLFDRLHDRPGECQDGPGGECQEWLCSACGAALLIGVIPFGADASPFGRPALAGTQPRGQVA